jgi:UDP-N-acetyl-D-glucosamine dehydrogenase
MICQMRVAIVGQGYVGLTISSGAFGAGHNVIGIDKSEHIVHKLNSGQSHIEGISDALVADAVKKGLYKATTSFQASSDADVVVIAVPTPLDPSGLPDLTMLESACESVAPYLNEKTLVINESTSYAGTLRNFIAKRIKDINPRVQLFAVSPERVDPGNEKYGVKNTPRLVGGMTKESADLAFSFYSTFCDNVVRVSSPEVAESAKLLENTFRFVNIGFISEFAQLMNAMNIPVSEVISAASTKPYGFMPFFPNVGVGGHCIPVDPLYLQKNAEDVGVKSRFIALSESLNHEMPEYCVRRLEEVHGVLNGKSVLVVGVSYKPNIADTRETPAEHVIALLKKKGAFVSFHDPLVATFNGENSSPVDGKYDLALVLVNHGILDMKSWQGGPIYCVNANKEHADWIPILGINSLS